MGKNYIQKRISPVHVHTHTACPLSQDPTIEDTTWPSKKQLIAPFFKIGSSFPRPHSGGHWQKQKGNKIKRRSSG
jgi:hypothetical protein